MRTVLPVLLFALAGVLAGGAWSLYRQGAGRGAVVVTGLLAGLALAGGALWLAPGSR
jgi:hypothetical protein